MEIGGDRGAIRGFSEGTQGRAVELRHQREIRGQSGALSAARSPHLRDEAVDVASDTSHGHIRGVDGGGGVRVVRILACMQ